MRLRRATLLCTRLCFALLLCLTSVYCVLVYVPFTRQSLLAWEMVGGLSAFSRWHAVLFPLLALPLCLTLREELRQAETRGITLGFIALNLLASVALTIRPLLTNLPQDERSFVWGVASLFPLVWLAAIDLKAGWRKRSWQARSSHTHYLAPVVASLFLALLYFVVFDLRYVTRGLARFTGKEMVIALAWSVLSHGAVFCVFFLALGVLREAARRFREPAKAWFVLRAVSIAAICAVALRDMVLSEISFDGLLAYIYAAALPSALVIFCAGLVVGLARAAADPWPRRLATLKRFLPSREATVAVRLLWLALVSVLAYLIPVTIASTDWDSMLQRLSALVIWALASLLFSRTGRANASPRSGLAALLLIALATSGAYKLLDSSRDRVIALLGNGRVDINVLLEQYASYEVSFGVTRRILSPPQAAGPGDEGRRFYEYLARSTNLAPGPHAKAPAVNLVPELRRTEGPKPHIFIFVIDSLRRDYVSPYNKAVKFTPSIESFAGESMVMENAFTRYGGTALSEPALWSGAMQLHMRYVQPFYPVNSLQRLIEVEGYKPYITVDPVLEEILRRNEEIEELDSGVHWEDYDLAMTLAELEKKLDERADSSRPIFAYTQSQNIHIAALKRHGAAEASGDYAGFSAQHAAQIARIDESFGKFVRYLKRRGLYDNSIIVLTSDHGDSLGEEGHWGHSTYLYPEVMRIPLIVHLPAGLGERLFCDRGGVAFTTDITPSLYYLLGHRSVERHEMFGRPLFTETAEEQLAYRQDYYLMASSYGAVYGVLSGDGRSLFIENVGEQKSYFYDMGQGPAAARLAPTEEQRAHGRRRILNGVKAINRFYGYDPETQQEGYSLRQAVVALARWCGGVCPFFPSY